MSLKISACLAAMLVACPLASQTAMAAYFNGHINESTNTDDKAESSGFNETFPKTDVQPPNYEYIYVGNAEGNNSQTQVISDNNTGTIGSGVSVSGDVIGGYAYSVNSNLKEIKVRGNSVTLQSGSKVETATGGYGVAATQLQDGAVSGNTVTVDEGAAVGTIYGGRVTSTIPYDSLLGYKFSYSVSQNTVTVTGSSFESAYGGSAETWGGSANNNTLVVKNGTSEAISTGELVGGYAISGRISFQVDPYDKVDASENTVTVTKSTVNTVFGGKAFAYANSATAKGNTVTLSDTEVQGTVYAGYALNSFSGECTASENKLYLNGGTYNGDIYGGYVSLYSGTAEAKGNLVALGQGSAGDVPNLEKSTIYGGYASVADEAVTTSGNTLKFSNVTGMKAVNIKNFQTLSYEYTEMMANEIILELKGTDSDQKTSIANAKVSVAVANLFGEDGKSEFKAGDKVVLLKNDNGLITDGIETSASITATTGISLSYEVEVQTSDDGKELILTRTGANPDDTDDDSGKTDDDSGDTDDDSGKTDDGGKTDDDSSNTGNDTDKDRHNGDTEVLPGTKAIAEAAASGLALVNESSNAAIEFLREFSLNPGSITPFVHVQASSMRHETGSSINLSTVSLLAGLGTGIDTGAGNLSVGAFFEYGKGSYTTHNSFDTRSDVDGDGNSWYMGGGILAKMDFVPTGPGHFYLEGSAHMGSLHNEYDSNDLRDANGNVAKFDMDSPYYSLHGGIGYVWNMAEGHDLDVYGKYIWTRVQGTDDTLTTKDKFEYDDMDSNRVRFGVRYSYNGSERFSPYVGAAFEHEFSGTCESTAYGHPVAAPSFEGSSGMGELGFVMNPSEDLPLSINLGVQGYVGQKQGVSGNFTLKYEF